MFSKLKAKRLAIAAAAVLAAGHTAVHAEGNTIEAGLLHHDLGSTYGNWNQQFLRGIFLLNSKNVLNADLVHFDQFGATGTLYALGLTHTFNDLWYGSASASGSSGGFFLPQSRYDIVANRKLGAASNVIATLGFTAIDSKDGHSDRSLLLAMTYYAPYALILEGGTRLNRSNPGAVRTNNYYVAGTWGHNKDQYISLRLGTGEEGYQVISADALLVNFRSRVATATWRKWVNQTQGFQVRAEAYHNPFYNRRGVEVSVFQEF